MQAVQKYDPYRGVKLSSYAAWWIRAYILRFILANWRLVKLGTTQAQRKLFFNLRKEREKLEKQGFEVEAKHLAAALDVPEQEVVEMERRLTRPRRRWTRPMRSDEPGDRTQVDFVRAAPALRPDVQVEAGEFGAILKEKLHAFRETLRDRDVAIFGPAGRRRARDAGPDRRALRRHARARPPDRGAPQAAPAAVPGGRAGRRRPDRRFDRLTRGAKSSAGLLVEAVRLHVRHVDDQAIVGRAASVVRGGDRGGGRDRLRPGARTGSSSNSTPT